MRNEYTLLWRPHPLMETTLSSMLPHLLERYRNMVREYKMKAYGIFDDTSDIHRAIALSDAYYGDKGSVVILYKETGKPCMIQNMKVKLV
jgi:phosphopantetheinyl transferase